MKFRGEFPFCAKFYVTDRSNDFRLARAKIFNFFQNFGPIVSHLLITLRFATVKRPMYGWWIINLKVFEQATYHEVELLCSMLWCLDRPLCQKTVMSLMSNLVTEIKKNDKVNIITLKNTLLWPVQNVSLKASISIQRSVCLCLQKQKQLH